MTIDWAILISSALVLWVPASLLYPVGARERMSTQTRYRYRLSDFFLTWQHWLDAIRGFGGAYFLVHYSIVGVAAARGAELYEAVALHAAVLAVATALQTVHYRGAIYCTAPMAFLLGMSFALSHWQAAFFAGAFGLALWKIRNFELKFPLIAVLLGSVGYFTSGADPHLILNCILLIFPLLLVYVTQTNFAVYTRQLAD